MKTIKTVIGAVVLLVSMDRANAHARFTNNNAVAPRSSSAGIKTGPCGGILTFDSGKSFTAGQEIAIEWVETVNHPGRYFIEFSAGEDKDFRRLKVVPDDQNDSNQHTYQTTVTLPQVNCTDCSLRLIQQMTESDLPSYYYSCSQRFSVTGATGGDTGGTKVPDDYGGSTAECSAH